MNKRIVKKVAVLGSGVMGSRIACHFANIGMEVVLLDIVPNALTDADKAKGYTTETKAFRNRVVQDSLDFAVRSNPSPLYHKSFAARIQTGNFEDNMSWIASCDWIIEVVVENLEIKKKVFDQVEQFRKKGALVTSNTSGIPIQLMTEGRSEEFKKHFCGTHFFNPPRYLRLLEVIPTKDTDKEVVDFLMHFGSLQLGKTTVLCKDTPAFIANRVGIYSIMKVLQTMENLQLTIDEVDKLTGPIIGRPKSATFRTADVVGLDTLIKVADNLYKALPQDESRELFQVPGYIRKMEANKWLGDKTGQGFYKKSKAQDGSRSIDALDIKTLEYRPQQKVKFQTLESTKSIEHHRDRFKVLLSGTDKAGEFYRHSFYGVFEYVSNRIPEISDELYRIDDAICAGFGWETGIFQTWDILGVEHTIKQMETLGYKPSQWVYDMVAAGFSAFYSLQGGKKMYFDRDTKAYKAIPGTEEFILLDTLKKDKVVWSNAGCTLYDIGDDVLNLEFHTKMNTLGSEVIAGINHAINLAERSSRGLVIANEGQNFSAGANLAMVFMYAIEQEFDEIDFMVRSFQNTMMRVRYSSIPVVVAPHALTLGGGCEMTLHADVVQALAETYIGLVEFGVGLIPAGGGTKEFVLRCSDAYESGDPELNTLQNAFMNIAMANVATSAYEAREMHIIRDKDRITVNKDRQIADAKAVVVKLSEEGYVQPIQRKDIKVLGKSAIALFKAGIHGMKVGRYISEHDQKIAEKLAFVMAGGDLSYPQLVTEQYLLDLEREAFVSLCGEKKTLERIQSILTSGKPLRN
jgi:3-hydroxyacyl-CoA dehydrogenase